MSKNRGSSGVRVDRPVVLAAEGCAVGWVSGAGGEVVGLEASGHWAPDPVLHVLAPVPGVVEDGSPELGLEGTVTS
jgi:hypothetical protein